MNILTPAIVGGLVVAAILEIGSSPVELLQSAQAKWLQAPQMQTVNRSNKQDRLTPAVAPAAAAQQRTRAPATEPQARETPNVPRSEKKMPIACEAVVSGIIRSDLSLRSGRCVT
ncbi:MAG: hypothetical protein AB7F51_14295 [Pseudorhodoplanes sp.]